MPSSAKPLASLAAPAAAAARGPAHARRSLGNAVLAASTRRPDTFRSAAATAKLPSPKLRTKNVSERSFFGSTLSFLSKVTQKSNANLVSKKKATNSQGEFVQKLVEVVKVDSFVKRKNEQSVVLSEHSKTNCDKN